MFRRTSQGVVQVISGEGPLAGDSVAEARQALLEPCEGGQPLAVFDLSQIALLDSEALEMLLEVRDTYVERGGELKLASPTSLCRDILDVTGVDRRFELHQEVTAAIGDFLR